MTLWNDGENAKFIQNQFHTYFVFLMGSLHLLHGRFFPCQHFRVRNQCTILKWFFLSIGADSFIINVPIFQGILCPALMPDCHMENFLFSDCFLGSGLPPNFLGLLTQWLITISPLFCLNSDCWTERRIC